MRICVVTCAHVGEHLADVMSSYLDSFKTLLAPHLPEATFSACMAIENRFPANVLDHDAYIVGGSPHGVYEDLPWIRRAEDFVREAVAADRVLVGGCFGHQLIAKALGGKVVKSEKGWGLGVHRHPVVLREAWMVGGPQAPNVVVSHQDQIVDPAPGSVVLASSPFCPNAMLRIGDRVLTLQGHPEMNISIANRLIDLRREQLGEAGFSEAKASLDMPLDHDAMAVWLAGFIRRGVEVPSSMAAGD